VTPSHIIIGKLASTEFKAGLSPTISLLAFDSTGKKHTVRALLDPSAQAVFITPKLANRLKLSLEDRNVPIVGIDSLESQSNHTSTVRIASHDLSFTHDTDILLLNKSTPLLPKKPLDYLVSKVSHLKLADPNFHKPLPVDLIMDVQLFLKIIRPGSFEGNANEPGRINSVFG